MNQSQHYFTHQQNFNIEILHSETENFAGSIDSEILTKKKKLFFRKQRNSLIMRK